MTFVVDVDTLVEVELDIVDELAVVEDVDFTVVEVVDDEVSFVVDVVDDVVVDVEVVVKVVVEVVVEVVVVVDVEELTSSFVFIICIRFISILSSIT